MSEKFERAFALTGTAAAFSALLIIKQINPAQSNLFPACLFHTLTGLNCPGCGATRGMHALLNGDILTALHFNAMLIVFVPLMIYGFVWLILFGIRGKGLPIPNFAARSLWMFLILMLGFGVLRNLPFYPFNLLAI